MDIYAYEDNDFNGFLCCLYLLVAKKEITYIFPLSKVKNGIIEFTFVESDELKAKKTMAAINRISKNLAWNIYTAWLSEKENIENDILYVIKLGKEMKKDPLGKINDLKVKNVISASKKLGGEAHRFKGYIRFKNVSNRYLISKVNPDMKILPVIAPHFAKRYKNENIMIWDINRNIVLVISMGKWVIAPMDEKIEHLFNIEDDFEVLWKEYFKTIAIKERKNKHLQSQFVPYKYRETITEFD